MAYQLRWSPAARDDLRDIVGFIMGDSPERAVSYASRLIAHTGLLPEHPEMGHRVPEHHNIAIRELIARPYRIIHRVNHDRETVEIVRM